MSMIIELNHYKENKLVIDFMNHIDLASDESNVIVLNMLNDMFQKIGYETDFVAEKGRLTLFKNSKIYCVQISRTGIQKETSFAIETSIQQIAGINSRTKKIYDGFVYVSRSYFSDEAKEYALNSERVQLIDRKKLFEILSQLYSEVSMSDYYDSIEELSNCNVINCSGKVIETTSFDVKHLENLEMYYHCLECGAKYSIDDIFKIVE